MTESALTVVINGDTRVVRGRSIDGIVQELGLPPASLLIEHNGDAVQRSEWASRAVRDGDRFEILRVAAGG